MSNTNDIYYKKYIKYKNKYFLLKGGDDKNKIIDFNDIKIIKELGHGLIGTIYLVQDIKNMKKYALKMENIFQKDTVKSLASPVWRENDFAETLSKLYPNHFMTLYGYKIDDKCKHQQITSPLEDLPVSAQKYYKKLFSSHYCSIKLWSLIDTTLDKLLIDWKEFKFDMFYDLFIQIIYVVYLMNKHGYFHRDFHTANIGLIKTNEKYINILGENIPTHGYFIQAIDYGLVLHQKYILNNQEKNMLKYDNDLSAILIILIFDTYFSILTNKFKNINIYADIQINKQDKQLLEHFLEKITVNNKWCKNSKTFLLKILYKILFFEKFERELLGDKFIEAIPLLYCIPLNVVLFIISNIYNTKDVLKYVVLNKKI